MFSPLFAKFNQYVPKQSGKRRQRMQHHFPQLLVAFSGKQNMLAQQHQFFPQFVPKLKKVERHRNLQTLQHVLSIKNSIALLHVQKFDGENAGGRAQLLNSQNQGRMMLLAPPPLGHLRDFRKRSKGRVANHAEQIQVRILRMKLSIGAGAVKYHAEHVVACSCTNSIDEFGCEFRVFFVRHISPHQLPLAPPPPELPPPKPPNPPPPPPKPPPPQLPPPPR